MLKTEIENMYSSLRQEAKTPAEQEIQKARQIFARAKQAKAAKYASEEFTAASEKLEKAEKSIGTDRRTSYLLTKRLAEEVIKLSKNAIESSAEEAITQAEEELNSASSAEAGVYAPDNYYLASNKLSEARATIEPANLDSYIPAVEIAEESLQYAKQATSQAREKGGLARRRKEAAKSIPGSIGILVVGYFASALLGALPGMLIGGLIGILTTSSCEKGAGAGATTGFVIGMIIATILGITNITDKLRK